MARRSTPVQPEDRILGALEIRNGITRLQQRIAELKALDPNSISEYRSPIIIGLETSNEDTLAAIFGHDTPKFRRYRYPATDLEPQQPISFVSDWNPRGGGDPGIDLGELRSGIADRKHRALAILEQAARSLSEEMPQEFPQQEVERTATLPKNAVFLVHGHDEAVLQAVARFLEQLDVEVIVLREQADSGRTIIEKFEHYAAQVGFAVILLTPDDIAGTANIPGSALRARQNVIFELGYFAGKLGRGRACLMKKGDVEIPSDLFGVIYKEFDASDGWKLQLVKELKAANISFDANKVWA